MYGFGEKAINILQAFFWFKIFTLVVTFYYINSYRSHEFYYYKNLGISKLKLWIPTLTFDFLLFLFSVIILAVQLHETHPRS